MNDAEFMREIGKLGGRPPGKRTKAQFKRDIVREEYRQMVLKDVKRLFLSQSVLAHGSQYLFRINKKQVGKDKWVIDGEPVLVRNPEEMQAYLNGLIHNKVPAPFEPYYFLTAVLPNGPTISDMLDRALGKERQVLGLEGSTPGSAVAVELTDKQHERLIREEFNRIGAGAVAGNDAGTEEVNTEEFNRIGAGAVAGNDAGTEEVNTSETPSTEAPH